MTTQTVCPTGIAWCAEHTEHTDIDDSRTTTHTRTVDIEIDPTRPDCCDGFEVISALVEGPAGRPDEKVVLLSLYWNDDGGDDCEVALLLDQAEQIGLELVAAAQRCRSWSTTTG